ncbi:MAG TPA: shikimate kinase [Syntrophales bacterium]|nr:shikimate kinase [Syntrophales bacterium]HOL58822.1 shikimate kinase [Syntrophales bacterium]HPO35149.1 shikimate kinase [Syntrophales bacterium]
MNIILMGFRATGKTTVGKILARELKRPFYDTDLCVQEEAGKTIREIVDEGGWSDFRQREKKAVALVARQDDCVLAVGGGAVLDEGNVRQLKAKGLFVWLKAGSETILQRLAADEQSEKRRPSLTGRNVAEETLELLRERNPRYEHLADLTIDTEGKRPEEVAEEILNELRRLEKEKRE